MTEDAPAIFIAIEQSGLGAAIRQSRWAYMVANVGHIVFLMIFAGAITVMDLRLAGAFSAMAPGTVLRTSRRAAIAALLGMAATGAVLFTAEASHVIMNPVFQIKLGLIALGLINIAVFEAISAAGVRSLPAHAPLPPRARIAAFASLAIWIAVAAAGRSIAYF